MIARPGATPPLEIAFFGSILTSAHWIPASAHHRGILAALHRRGHRVTVYEAETIESRARRDIDAPPWANVVLYPSEDVDAPRRALAAAGGADVIIKVSHAGAFDDLLDEAVPSAKRAGQKAIFWDIDPPATIDRLRRDPADPLRAQIPRYDLVLTHGGGPPIVKAYESFGARRVAPIYNAVDPVTHFAVPPNPLFFADLSFLANRRPDRDKRLDEMFFQVAAASPRRRFLLGGAGYDDMIMPENVTYVGHVKPAMHNAFNASALAVLSVGRDRPTRIGFSPAARIFEAAGAGACVITDAWEGIDLFLDPGREVLVARSGDDVVRALASLTPARARAIGVEARRRVLLAHTYAERAGEIVAWMTEPPR